MINRPNPQPVSQWWLWHVDPDMPVWSITDLKMAIVMRFMEITEFQIPIFMDFRVQRPFPNAFLSLVTSRTAHAENRVTSDQYDFAITYERAATFEDAMNAENQNLNLHLDSLSNLLMHGMEYVQPYDKPMPVTQREVQKTGTGGLYFTFRIPLRMYEFPPEHVLQWRLRIVQRLRLHSEGVETEIVENDRAARIERLEARIAELEEMLRTL